MLEDNEIYNDLELVKRYIQDNAIILPIEPKARKIAREEKQQMIALVDELKASVKKLTTELFEADMDRYERDGLPEPPEIDMDKLNHAMGDKKVTMNTLFPNFLK